MGNCQLKASLFRAVQEGDESKVAQLLNQFGPDGDLSFVQPGSGTPLHVACICGHVGVTTLLLAHGGAPLDARDDEGRTPLYVAAMGGHAAIVRLLLSPPRAKLVDADVVDESVPPRPCASVNLRSRTGLNALFVAAWRGHREVAIDLLSHGADLLVTEEGTGRHAWDAAREWGHTSLADELEMLARQAGFSPMRLPADTASPVPSATPDAVLVDVAALESSTTPPIIIDKKEVPPHSDQQQKTSETVAAQASA